MFEDHFSFSQGGICDRCLEGISNYSNYPERGEIFEEKLMNLSMPSYEIHMWTCEFPHGSKCFVFYSGVKSSHCQPPGCSTPCSLFFRRSDARGHTNFYISGRSSCPRQLRHFIPNFCRQQMKSNGCHLSGPWGTPPEIWRNVRWKIVLWRFRSFPFEMVPC